MCHSGYQNCEDQDVRWVYSDIEQCQVCSIHDSFLDLCGTTTQIGLQDADWWWDFAHLPGEYYCDEKANWLKIIFFICLARPCLLNRVWPKVLIISMLAYGIFVWASHPGRTWKFCASEISLKSPCLPAWIFVQDVIKGSKHIFLLVLENTTPKESLIMFV